MEFLASLHQYNDIALFILRAGIAMVFLVHGKWKMEQGNEMAECVHLPKKGWFFTGLGYAEFLGSLALISGFLTQIAAAGLAIILIGAIYFKIQKWKISFTSHSKIGWEFDLVLLTGCLAIYFLGAGKLALDAIIFRLF